jgi:thiamine transport system permease protein
MADRAQPVNAPALAGWLVAGLLIALSFGTLAVVALRATGPFSLSSHDLSSIRFTVVQALVSALVSTALAIPAARALARRRFWGRGLLIRLLGAPFILPMIVAVIGLVAVFGRSGLVNSGLAYLGYDPISIYGFSGVVLAHVFLNLPLATRLLLQGWSLIPSERFRLAAQLRLSPWGMFRHLEWPMLRSTLPGIALTVFLLCLTSFAVALTLGGGPRATTIELAIYQAFRFDFNLGRAASLALIQFALCGVGALLAWFVAKPAGLGVGLDRPVELRAGAGLSRTVDAAVLIPLSLFLIFPLLTLILRGLIPLLDLPTFIWLAAIRSLVVALGAAFLALLLAGMLAQLALRLERHQRRGLGGMVESAGYLSLATSPMVLGTGLFIVVFPFADPAALALFLTMGVNAVISLPFVLRALLPALREVVANYDRLRLSLGMSERAFTRLVVLPRLRHPIGFSLGLSAALSMGDLGVVALFADPNSATLPLALYRLMAAYKMEAASGAALLLLGLSFGLFVLFDRSGGRHAEP